MVSEWSKTLTIENGCQMNSIRIRSDIIYAYVCQSRTPSDVVYFELIYLYCKLTNDIE